MIITPSELAQVTAAIQNNPNCYLYIKGSDKVKSQLNKVKLNRLITNHTVEAMMEVSLNSVDYELIFEDADDLIIEVLDDEEDWEEINLNPGFIQSDIFCPINKQQYLNQLMITYFS